MHTGIDAHTCTCLQIGPRMLVFLRAQPSSDCQTYDHMRPHMHGHECSCAYKFTRLLLSMKKIAWTGRWRGRMETRKGSSGSRAEMRVVPSSRLMSSGRPYPALHRLQNEAPALLQSRSVYPCQGLAIPKFMPHQPTQACQNLRSQL